MRNEPIDYKLVIFDMDGLMFDTEAVSWNTWNEAFRIHKYTLTRNVFEMTLGLSMAKTQELFTEAYGSEFPFESIKRERERLSDLYIKLNGVPLKTGLIELLTFLQSKSIIAAVATSASQKRATHYMNITKLENYFSCILCGDQIINSKPDPEIFTAVANALNIPPNKCIVLEDSKMGIVAASRAGMIPIMIPDLLEPNAETEKLLFKKFNNLLEVRHYLEALNY